MTAVNIKNILDTITEPDDVAKSEYDIGGGETLYLFGTKSEQSRDAIENAIGGESEVLEPKPED